MGTLFGDRIAGLDFSFGSYLERVPGGARGYCVYRETFGPARALYDSLADRPDDQARLDPMPFSY